MDKSENKRLEQDLLRGISSSEQDKALLEEHFDSPESMAEAALLVDALEDWGSTQDIKPR